MLDNCVKTFSVSWIVNRLMGRGITAMGRTLLIIYQAHTVVLYDTTLIKLLYTISTVSASCDRTSSATLMASVKDAGFFPTLLNVARKVSAMVLCRIILA